MERMLARMQGTVLERRRTRRFEVDLPGTVQVAGRRYPARISDISSGGALVSLTLAVEAARSDQVVVTIDGFGAIPAVIVRCDAWSWGVGFVNPQQHRFRLIGWLQRDIGQQPTG